MVLNDRNGRRQLIVVLMEVSSLLLLPKVATAAKGVWMVYLLNTELELLLRHGILTVLIALCHRSHQSGRKTERPFLLLQFAIRK